MTWCFVKHTDNFTFTLNTYTGEVSIHLVVKEFHVLKFYVTYICHDILDYQSRVRNF